MFLDRIKHVLRVFLTVSKTTTKSVSLGSPNKGSNCEGMILAYKSMVEEGWLKMLRKRKFRELKTADEEKALLEKSFPKSTRYVTNWSSIFFAQG